MTMVTVVDELVVVAKATDASGEWEQGFLRRSWSEGATSFNGSSVIPPGHFDPADPAAVARGEIRTKIANSQEFTVYDLKRMDDLDIDLNEVLAPGIYQMEFNVVVAGVPSPFEHLQWVKVNENGDSEIITATFNGGKLDFKIESWEDSDHGREHVGTDLRFAPIGATIGNKTVTDEKWSKMMATAQAHDMLWNYNASDQNSNSAFFTVGKSADIVAPDLRGWQPGYGLDLNTLTPSNQSSPLTGVGDLFTMNGTAGDDQLIGGAQAAVLNGGDGNDRIEGLSSSDLITGGFGADTILLLGGGARGDDGNDNMTITGSGGGQLAGDAGDDMLNGGGGGDALEASIGNDWVHGKVGDDQLDLGAGNDTGYGGQGDDVIQAGEGYDLVYGDLGTDVLLGEGGVDSLYGKQGEDVLIGGGSGDYIFGGPDGDFIRGGEGADHIWGGLGADTYAFSVNRDAATWWRVNESGFFTPPRGGRLETTDTIYDFQSGIDKIDLTGWPSFWNFSHLEIKPLTDASGIKVQMANEEGFAVRLINVYSVQASDFIFAEGMPAGISVNGQFEQGDAQVSAFTLSAGKDTLAQAHPVDVVRGELPIVLTTIDDAELSSGIFV